MGKRLIFQRMAWENWLAGTLEPAVGGRFIRRSDSLTILQILWAFSDLLKKGNRSPRATLSPRQTATLLLATVGCVEQAEPIVRVETSTGDERRRVRAE